MTAPDPQATADAVECVDRITGAELVEVISKHPDWLELPVHLLAMTDDSVWLTHIERDCFDEHEGPVLSLVALAPAIAEPLANPRKRVETAADEVAAWIDGAHDDDLIELEARTLRTLLADRVRMAAELEQVREKHEAVEAWLGGRIGALRKVLRNERDATRAARAEAESLRQELDEAASIVMEIGEALNTTELYIAIGDLAQLFAFRTVAPAEREAAETAAMRPADGLDGAVWGAGLGNVLPGPQRGAEGVAPCRARSHPDFGDVVPCELPDGHAAHRNGTREWMP